MMSNVELYLGDCLDYLRALPSGSADAVITDPPYSIGVKSDMSGKINPWGDRMNAVYWYREWIGQAQRILKPSGCLWSFFNWRSFVIFQKTSDDLGWSIESKLIWDKSMLGPGGMKGLRPVYEEVGLWAKENFSIPDRGLRDIQTFATSSVKPTGHPAEKPLALLRWLVKISTRPGDLVIDPFLGSGTTGVACVETERNFIGYEIDQTFFVMAERRIREAQQQPGLPMELQQSESTQTHQLELGAEL